MRNTQAKIPVVFVLKDNALKKAEKGLGHLESKAKNFAKSIAGLALAGGIEEFARKSVEAAVKMEAANAKLGVALKNIGQSAALGGEAIKKTNEQMANLGFTGADSAQALANLVTVTHSLDKAQSLMGQAADVARYKQISLSDAATKLARASAGTAKGLAEFGIKLDKTLKPADAFKKAMSQLNAEISGQAAAYAETYAGKLEILKAKFDEVQVSVGEVLLPKLVELGDWLINTGIPDLQSFFGFISKNLPVLEGLAGALTTVALAFKLINTYAKLAAISALPLMGAAAPFVAAIAAFVGLTAYISATTPKKKLGTVTQQNFDTAQGLSKQYGGKSPLKPSDILHNPGDTWDGHRWIPNKFGNPTGQTFGKQLAKPEVNKVALQQLAATKEANALAAKKAKADALSAKAALINKRLAAQFDLTQIELAASLQGKLTQDQIDKVKALQSMQDDGYKTDAQMLAEQQIALNNLLKTKQDLANVRIGEGVAATLGTGVNGGGGERQGGQTDPGTSGTGGATSSSAPPPASGLPTPPIPDPGINAAVGALAATAANAMGATARGEYTNAPAAAPITINVAGSVLKEQELIALIQNGTQLSSLSGSPSQIGRIQGMFG